MNVIGIGNLVLDYYFYDDKIYVNGGNTISNVLANLSSMGINCKIFGYYGNDKLGKLAKESLESVGVDTSLLIEKNGHTKAFFIYDGETNAICPLCHNKRKNFKKRNDIEKYIDSSDILLIQDYNYIENIDNKICLDFGYYDKLINEDIENIKKFIFRQYFIVSLKEEVLLYLLERIDITFKDFILLIKINLLIITKGKKGVTLVYKNKVINCSCEVIDEVETNGCGDIFLATFISEILKNYDIDNLIEKDLLNIFDLAQKNVAVVLKRIGARDHLFENRILIKTDKCICEDFDIK